MVEVRAKHGWPISLGALLAACVNLAACGMDVGGGELGAPGAAGFDQGVQPGVFRLRAAHSDKCLAIAGASGDDRARLQQFTCSREPEQHFELRDVGSGRYDVVAVHSQKCIEVAGNSNGNGVGIQQARCSGVDPQRWTFDTHDDGQVSIRSVKSGKCLDVDDRSTADGANLQQWRCHGGENQRFRLEPVGGDGDDDGDDGEEDGDDVEQPAEPALPPCLRTVRVSGSSELSDALSRARAGDCIVLADGVYTFPRIAARGAADEPIVIRAENRLGAAVERGNLELRGAAHVIMEGLHFRSTGRIRLEDCDHCRISRFRMQRSESEADVDWLTIAGKSKDCRVDHSDFGPQTKLGNMIMLAGSRGQIVQRTRIDHNYFHDVQYSGGNGWEIIRAGLSNYTFSSAFTVIEHNLFVRAHSDPETISIKSSDNIVRHNTMRETNGQFTLRHGNRTSVYGNYILGDGAGPSAGIRVYGGEHKIYNNYLADIDGPAILVDSGKTEDASGALTDHKVSYRVQVLFNTIVNERGIQIGGGKPLKPKDCVIAHNVLQGDGGLLRQESGTRNTSYLSNIVHKGSTNIREGTLRVDPALERHGDTYRIGEASPAIDGAGDEFDWVTEDIAGRPRDRSDLGAHERSSQPARYKLLTSDDVGPFAP
jgi:poly(beta-D-mannuronate) lyase